MGVSSSPVGLHCWCLVGLNAQWSLQRTREHAVVRGKHGKVAIRNQGCHVSFYRLPPRHNLSLFETLPYKLASSFSRIRNCSHRVGSGSPTRLAEAVLYRDHLHRSET
jgi:hypothetical protein